MFKQLIRLIVMALAICLWIVACAPNASKIPSAAQPLKVGTGLWIGFSGDYVARAKNFYADSGVNVQETLFSDASAGVTGFLAGQVDLLWTASSNVIQMHDQDPSFKAFYLADYSNGGDGIVARNVDRPQDLKGKTIARENLLYNNIILQAYLQQAGLTEQDVVLKDLAGPDAAAAFVAKQVDAAITDGLWLARAAQTGNGKIIFSTKDTNLVADVIVVRQQVLDTRKSELQAYLKAVDRGVKLINSGDPEALKIVASKLEVEPEQVKQQLGWIKLFDIEGNKKIAFNPNDSNSLIKNLEFTAQVARTMKINTKPIAVQALYDSSVVNAF